MNDLLLPRSKTPNACKLHGKFLKKMKSTVAYLFLTNIEFIPVLVELYYYKTCHSMHDTSLDYNFSLVEQLWWIRINQFSIHGTVMMYLMA